MHYKWWLNMPHFRDLTTEYGLIYSLRPAMRFVLEKHCQMEH